VLVALLLSMMLDGAAPADDAPAPAADVQVQAQASPLVKPAAPTSPEPFKDLKFVWRDHPSLRAGRNFRIDFTAKMQYDVRDPGDDPEDFPTGELHRLRVGVEGEVFRHIQFQVERELSEREVESAKNDPNSGGKLWKDVYVEANYSNKAQVRVGKFKIPFGLDETSGEAELDFVYRSLAGSYLSPARDIGVMVNGRFFKRGLNYWGGWFQQDGENSQSTPRHQHGGDDTCVSRHRHAAAQGPAVQERRGRRQRRHHVRLGRTGPSERTARSHGHVAVHLFRSDVRQRDPPEVGTDVDWTDGPMGLRAGASTSATTAMTRDWQRRPPRRSIERLVRAGNMGGDRRQESAPARAEEGLFRGGLGAVELGARYDTLRFSGKPGTDPPFRNSRAETIYPNGDKVVTLGVNYYANRWAKVQFNLIREHIEDIERSPTVDGSAFWSSVVRFQLQL
jgi:phosphate-selective porin